jgi:hypothetical protein
MKPIEEIESILVSDLWKSMDRIISIKEKLNYYNEILEGTSYLLAGLLESLIEKKFDDWDFNKWIDDSLLTKLELKDDKLSIWGVMIWGIENTTEQWTEPFYFEIKLLRNKMDFKEYTFLFSDLDNPEISYEVFGYNRDYWHPTERNWKYIINSKK